MFEIEQSALEMRRLTKIAFWLPKDTKYHFSEIFLYGKRWPVRVNKLKSTSWFTNGKSKFSIDLLVSRSLDSSRSLAPQFVPGVKSRSGEPPFNLEFCAHIWFETKWCRDPRQESSFEDKGTPICHSNCTREIPRCNESLKGKLKFASNGWCTILHIDSV